MLAAQGALWACVPGTRRLKDLEAENARPKKLLAEQIFENDVIKDVLRKKS
jgi:putative transposase